tara:strand:- start:547 stop:732 length:186 start_codon:yes stop_codon:yes gene_type:complete
MVYCNQVSERITQTEFVMEKELIGWFDDSMSDEDVIEMINEIEAEEAARLELADHAMNFEV